MAQHNPFLDPAREIQQGRSDDDILADVEERRRLSSERIASLGPGDTYSGTLEELARNLYAGADARTEIFSVTLADIKSHYIGETEVRLRDIYGQIAGCLSRGSNILIEIDELLLPESIRRSAGSGGGFESAVENVIYSGVLEAFAKLRVMEGVAAVSAHTTPSGKEYRLIFCNGPDREDEATGRE